MVTFCIYDGMSGDFLFSNSLKDYEISIRLKC